MICVDEISWRKTYSCFFVSSRTRTISTRKKAEKHTVFRNPPFFPVLALKMSTEYVVRFVCIPGGRPRRTRPRSAPAAAAPPRPQGPPAGVGFAGIPARFSCTERAPVREMRAGRACQPSPLRSALTAQYLGRSSGEPTGGSHAAWRRCAQGGGLLRVLLVGLRVQRHRRCTPTLRRPKAGALAGTSALHVEDCHRKSTVFGTGINADRKIQTTSSRLAEKCSKYGTCILPAFFLYFHNAPTTYFQKLHL